MSQNWYALTGDISGNTYQIAYHLTVPPGNNLAGVAWNTALVNSGLGGTTILKTGTGAGQITSADLALIQAGTLYEYIEPFYANPSFTPSQLATQVTTRFNAINSSTGPVFSVLQNQLQFFGGVG